ncbi:MAG: hypothetical protein L0G63_01225 [Psychrobacter sp.]|uniref:hypothetical protein n=1 Tax=Psychrobacter sp. TaxID=56811 RepID=UPI00264A26F6|nr:hypothetical protein [Psychrobacter sp.]MDN5619091.1 hypothetical protein [Psychrobacter sp.]
MTWTLSRKDTQSTLTLHAQYIWSDEYEWSPLKQSEPEYSLNGAMHVQQGTMLAGRPITLDCEYARITRSDVELLQAWSAVPELELTLTHPDGRAFDVIFATQALSDIVDIKNYKPSDKRPADPMTANIHLMTI